LQELDFIRETTQDIQTHADWDEDSSGRKQKKIKVHVGNRSHLHDVERLYENEESQAAVQ